MVYNESCLQIVSNEGLRLSPKRVTIQIVKKSSLI